MNDGACVAGRRMCRQGWAILMIVLAVWAGAGCTGGPRLLQPDLQGTIDRKAIEYPADTELKTYIEGRTAPTAITFDPAGTLLIAEGGFDGHRARVFGFKADGTF